jgi:hypothetical protein
MGARSSRYKYTACADPELTAAANLSRFVDLTPILALSIAERRLRFTSFRELHDSFGDALPFAIALRPSIHPGVATAKLTILILALFRRGAANGGQVRGEDVNNGIGSSTPLQPCSQIRETVEISVREKSIIAILGNVAELGASRMEETIGAAGLRDAAIGTGIAVDKMLALTGQLPSVQIANVVLPTPQEDAERRAIDAKLDEITRLLHAPKP